MGGLDRKVTEIVGYHYKTEEPVTISVQDGIITNIEKRQPAEDKADLSWIGPGLVDLQINGYNGWDFNTFPIEKESVMQLTRAVWREGVTSYYPTVITNGDEQIEQALRCIATACAEDSVSDGGVAGIHLEGPFISREDGPRGAHSKSFTKAPDWSLFQKWQEAAEGKIKIVTVSPEWPGTARFIEKCAEQRITVSIGHTAATGEQIAEAVRAGATMSTHLGNGSHLMLPRHPNYIWDQLAEDKLSACIIGDGFHLPDSVLKVVMRTKGDKTMLVSDAVGLSGMPPGTYDNHIGGQVDLTPEGKLHVAGNPKLLAGSVQMLPRGVEHLAAAGLAPLYEAWEMASVRPAAFMNLPSQQGLAVGAPADLVVFAKKGQRLSIEQTYKHGIRVFATDENRKGV